jgi:RNA recognition motif-containing protein
MTIFIRNLPLDVGDEDLKEFFIEYGEVRSAQIKRDHYTGFSRGFGYVNMPDADAALKAIKELDKGKVEGQVIQVMKARPKKRKKQQAKG